MKKKLKLLRENMNIMNKFILASIILLCYSSIGFAQIFRTDSYSDLQIYPTTSNQIEHYNGVSRLINFNTVNFGKARFNEFEYKGKVSSIMFTKYYETERWDEKVWVEQEKYDIKIINDIVTLNGSPLINGQASPDLFTVLGINGEDEKEGHNIRATYTRDDEGRVARVSMYNRYNALFGLYRYTYVDNTDKISRIEWFDSQATLVKSISYIWSGKLLSAIMLKEVDGTRPNKTYQLSYDSNGNISHINYYESYEYKKETKHKGCKFKYTYSGNLISSCIFQWSNQPQNPDIEWTFEYDENGNWVEMITRDTDTAYKICRQISYTNF